MSQSAANPCTATPFSAYRPPCFSVVEMGFGQEQAVRDVAAAQRYVVDEIIPDLAGIPRVVILSTHA